ncbi:MAG: hypothetical protein CBB68_03440 [Rhodospirillaceae bacterium TMED8]|nr:MAG: hypothetical protein CBB68_03440 [Rhodospirillaceae bacterium TMED8]|tara:strand:+ start:486 stop:683 length:198 start_codon:yes stop_codon:yes gene_type:complete
MQRGPSYPTWGDGDALYADIEVFEDTQFCEEKLGIRGYSFRDRCANEGGAALFLLEIINIVAEIS